MCLQALGVQNCDEDTVNRVLGAAPMKGATWEQVLATAQHYGVRATLTVPATLSQVKGWTDAGKPVMIGWNPEGREWSHASVIFDVQECPTHGFMVHVADPNCPDPEQTVRIVPKSEFYAKWYEKFPNYLVRRPALVLEREVTPEGRQVMASLRSPVLVDAPTVVPVEVPVSKQAKAPVQVGPSKKNPNVMRGEAPARRNTLVQESVTRGWGSGTHGNRDYDVAKGRSRNEKHKGQKGWGAEYMALPVEEACGAEYMGGEACGAEYMQGHSAKFEEGVSVDPTKNMSEADAAEWKKQNAIHRSEFKTARVLSKGDSTRRLNELHKQHGGFTRAYFEAALQEVKAGVIAPAAVVGGGYKDGKAVAIKWLTDNMSKAKTAAVAGLLPSEVADKVAKLMSRQEAILKKYVEEAGSRAVDQYDDLPKSVRDALTRVKDQETLWSDAERWLSDNRSRRASVNRADLLPSEAYRLRAAGLEDACWNDYEAVGMKEQGGEQVPNCVPVKKARYDRGPLSPSEKNDLFESNPEFADMNENPPESVLSVREQMGRQAARKFRAPF